ncbi:hypothetical protein JCM8097_001979 [Rhodosporidiobolus ruineniae]
MVKCPFPAIPANARASLVALTRPCLVLLALLYALGSYAASAFFAATGLNPPTCPRSVCTENEPRTRPRPQPSPAPKPSPPTAPKPTALQQLVAAFRPATRRPPPARRGSARALAVAYPVHELDELTEAREEEELAELEEEKEAARSGLHKLSRTPSPDEHAPALTPDGGSDADSDGASEVDTLEDDQAHSTTAKGGAAKPKGLSVFTGLRFRRTPSTGSSKKAATSPVVASPDESSAAPSPASSVHSASSSSLKNHCPIKGLRNRAATTAGTSRPNLPSILTTRAPRRQFSEPGPPSPDYFSGPAAAEASSSTASSSLSSVATSSLLPDSTTASSSTSLSTPPASVSSVNRKRSVSSLFRTPFGRSLSPHAPSSPLTSPEPSPPPSPVLGAAPAFGRSASLTRKAGRTRSRSPVPLPVAAAQQAQAAAMRPPPLTSRVSSGPGADLSGASGLALSDVLRR